MSDEGDGGGNEDTSCEDDEIDAKQHEEELEDGLLRGGIDNCKHQDAGNNEDDATNETIDVLVFGWISLAEIIDAFDKSCATYHDKEDATEQADIIEDDVGIEDWGFDAIGDCDNDDTNGKFTGADDGIGIIFIDWMDGSRPEDFENIGQDAKRGIDDDDDPKNKDDDILEVSIVGEDACQNTGKQGDGTENVVPDNASHKAFLCHFFLTPILSKKMIDPKSKSFNIVDRKRDIFWDFFSFCTKLWNTKIR